MPPWAHLAESDRVLLAEQVLELRRQGARDVELAIAAEDEEELSEEELAELVASVTAPGDLIEVPPLGEPSAETIETCRTLRISVSTAYWRRTRTHAGRVSPVWRSPSKFQL